MKIHLNDENVYPKIIEGFSHNRLCLSESIDFRNLVENYIYKHIRSRNRNKIVQKNESASGWVLNRMPANQDGSHSRSYFNIEPYGKFIDKYSHLEILAHLETNFSGMVTTMVYFKIISDDPSSLTIFSSVITCSVGTKLWWNGSDIDKSLPGERL